MGSRGRIQQGCRISAGMHLSPVARALLTVEHRAYNPNTRKRPPAGGLTSSNGQCYPTFATVERLNGSDGRHRMVTSRQESTLYSTPQCIRTSNPEAVTVLCGRRMLAAELVASCYREEPWSPPQTEEATLKTKMFHRVQQ